MKKLLYTVLLLLPTVVLGVDFRVELSTYDSRATAAHAECRIDGAPFAQVGSGPAAGPIAFSLEIQNGQNMDCRVWSTADGFTDSPRSDLAGYTHAPLQLIQPGAPVIIRVAP